LSSGGGFKPFSRETLLLLNNIFLVVAAGAVLLGTLYPLLMDAFGLGKLSVGPPYFKAVFVPIMLPFLILIGIGPYVRWKRGDAHDTVRAVRVSAVAALLVAIVCVALAGSQASLMLAAGILLGSWAILSALQEPLQRLRARRNGRHITLPRAMIGMSLAHLGAGLLVLGITVTSILGAEEDRVMAPGSTASVAGYQFKFDGVHTVQGPNYQAEQGMFEVTHDGRTVTTMLPEKRKFTTTVTTEAAIDPGVFRDLYVALGNPLDNDAWSVRLQYKPLVRFIWLGGLFMMLGGILAASDRRYRRSPAQLELDPGAVEPVKPAKPGRRTVMENRE
ncbi:MAG TPA: cytochrome c-type biogenesis CcmF C-terminal domain-containing protein, partial [Gammaproteobacteria bacterium]